eukprot:jgi/Tetstr1/462877/TSEL_007826.t1
MTFSGTVKLSGLDDHITPSQACVVALDGTKIDPTDMSEEVQIHSREDKPAPAMKEGADGKPVTISLQDCLACSGCITTAETVLLQQQSVDEFRSRLAEPGTVTIASVSPQTRASLAEYYGLSAKEAGARLAGYLKSLGVQYVLDLSSARDVSLMEAAAEFCQRFRFASSNAAGQMEIDGTEAQSATAGPLPMLASACPGWVCYAEKTHGEYVLPYISTSKSPQAVMGTLLKRQVAACHGMDPAKAFHCSFQPCFDKKLEASREDFETEAKVKETDCVLSTLEVVEMLNSQGLDLKDCPAGSVDSLLALIGGQPAAGAEDDGALYGWPGALEVVLTVNDEAVLRFATAYGFRNIQTLMRKIKRKQCEYQYVEIMACPSGCLNGGGQMRPKEGQSVQELIQKLDETYHHQDVRPRWPADNPLVRYVYTSPNLGSCYGPQARNLLHTQYHQREKSVSTAIVDW